MSAQVTEAHIARARASGFSTDKGLQMAAQFIANNEAAKAERDQLRAENKAIRHELAVARNAECLARTQLDLARAELASEREKVKTLGSALQSLVDEQNGAPLETRRSHWEMAMDEAGLALAVTEESA
jgi:hypothetical protein